MDTRREALRRLASLMAVGGVTDRSWLSMEEAVSPESGALAMVADDARRITNVGLQLYTVRTEMQKSVPATLARVAAIGYREVEFAGYFGHAPRDVAGLLKQHALAAPATHVGMDLVRTRWDQTLDDCAAIGHTWAVVPYIDNSERSVDGYRRIAEEFNRAGEAARKRGLRLAYHNHDFEFAAVGGTTGFEILMTNTDSSLVEFELDLFWIAKGAGRAAATTYFGTHPGRFPLVHVKDMAADGRMVDVGAGTIDFTSIFAQATKAGIRHYFVEHDQPGDPFASVTASYRTLSAIPSR